MTTIGLRELRQSASEVVRRVEAGEEITITVAGRPRARIIPTQPQRWRTQADLDHLFDGPVDLAWDNDRDLIDHTIRDPWAAQ